MAEKEQEKDRAPKNEANLLVRSDTLDEASEPLTKTNPTQESNATTKAQAKETQIPSNKTEGTVVLSHDELERFKKMPDPKGKSHERDTLLTKQVKQEQPLSNATRQLDDNKCSPDVKKSNLAKLQNSDSESLNLPLPVTSATSMVMDTVIKNDPNLHITKNKEDKNRGQKENKGPEKAEKGRAINLKYGIPESLFNAIHSYMDKLQGESNKQIQK